jgi:hypothetical protein
MAKDKSVIENIKSILDRFNIRVSTKNIRKDVGWGEKYKKYKREK